ncbi:MAG TPA: hypothetical protein VF669_15105, partial [Tepidisphaeraceae bacterium]
MLISAALGAVPYASGGVRYDLRFADGSHTQMATAGGSYTLELWARVSGANNSLTDDGIQSSYVKILSSQSNGGAIVAGGFSIGQVTSEFQSFSVTAPAHRNGSGSDLNGDGVIDWGSSSTSSADTRYMLARAAGIVSDGGTVGQSVNANTWEYRLATFTVDIASVGIGTTSFDLVKPNATTGVAITYATARVDGAAFNVQSTNTQGAYVAGNGVTFTTVPAPNIAWDGGPTGAGSDWNTAENWGVDSTTSTEHVPTAGEFATFGAAGSSTVIGINMAGATNNGPGNQAVGAIALDSTASHDITIQNSSSTNGVLRLNGYNGVLLTNDSINSTLT